MAFYQDNEDELNQEGAPPTTGAQSGIVGQGSTQGAGQATSAPVQNSAPKQSNPGNFVGIQQYVNANKPQSAKLAQNVAGTVTEQGNQARQALSEGQNQFNQAVEKNTVGLNQNLFNEAKANPNQVALDQAKKAEFQKMRDANYAGPASFEGTEYYQGAKQAIDKANQASENTKSLEGQKTLLSGLQNKRSGKVNEGALAFDSALLQADPTARAKLESARAANADLTQSLGNANIAGVQKAQAAKEATDSTRRTVREGFGGIQGDIETELNKRASEQQGIAQKNIDTIKDTLSKGGQLTPEQYRDLGISPEQLAHITQIQRKELADLGGDASGFQDLSKYLQIQNPMANISAQNVASADDYARYAALNDLMGTQGSFLSDPSMAGKASTDAIDFDLGRAQRDITGAVDNRKAVLEQQRKDAEAEAARQAEAARKAEELRKQTNLATNLAMGGPVGAAIGEVLDRNLTTDTAAGAVGSVADTAKSIAAPVANIGKKIFRSDENSKKNIKPFDARKFLDSLCK